MEKINFSLVGNEAYDGIVNKSIPELYSSPLQPQEVEYSQDALYSTINEMKLNKMKLSEMKFNERSVFVVQQQAMKKLQIVITIILLLILLALGVLLILETSVLVTGNTCTCGDTTANSSGGDGSGADEVNQVLQIVRDISDKQIFHHQNTTQSLFNTIGDVNDKFNAIEEALENSTHSLTDTIAGSSSHLENACTSGVDELINIQTKLLSSLQSISCKSIKSQQPNSPTGYYYNANSRVIFCNMGELCGSGGGWTRLAYLNMTDDTENCPSGFRLYREEGVRACGRPASGSGGCSSVKFPSNGISYSEICGRVVGYQYGSTDAVHNPNNNSINGAYVDGVSITLGSPRQHVWTLMAGERETENAGDGCPCNIGSSLPLFIGSNYFCESGDPSPNPFGYFHQSDPLWDGEGCDDNESRSCCSSPDLPWFHRDYGNTTTTDYIELRVCADEGADSEDVPVGLYEIYIK